MIGQPLINKFDNGLVDHSLVGPEMPRYGQSKEIMNTVGIITDPTAAPMPNWEALLLSSASDEDRRKAVLEERCNEGNAHPQERFNRFPEVAQTIGMVYSRLVEDMSTIDNRDIVVANVIGVIAHGLRFERQLVHITWRATDQYVPGNGMMAVGLVVLRADGRREFQPFEFTGISLPLDSVHTYVKGLPSTSY